jgi:hypothetical protein
MKGKKIGYFAMVLSKMRNELREERKISKAQIRLILKEFEESGYADSSIPFHTQKEVFIEIVSKYVWIPKDRIRQYLVSSNTSNSQLLGWFKIEKLAC